jgi:putative glutamine amidotransferase
LACLWKRVCCGCAQSTTFERPADFRIAPSGLYPIQKIAGRNSEINVGYFGKLSDAHVPLEVRAEREYNRAVYQLNLWSNPLSDPIIGLPTYNAYDEKPDYVMRKAYVMAIEAAGGVPLLLPLLEDEHRLRRLYDVLDGLLLCGGGDVAPHFYGTNDTGKCTLIDEPRDRVELALTRWAVADGMPILGICRGIQVLNVALGGTLYQHIPKDISGALRHRTPAEFPPDYVAHEVLLKPASLLLKTLAVEPGEDGHSRIEVNSRHHQAIKDVAPGFCASAHAPDGVIEAIEPTAAGSAFVLGVQWHAEDLVPASAAMTRLFCRFVQACQR